MMHRLFVAIRPPAETRAALLAVMGGVAGARWQRDEQLHLTLRFIGEVDARTARDAVDALETVRHLPVEIVLAGLGMFDRKGRPEALWCGVSDPAPLAALHRKIDRALVGIGLPPEGRAYKPHVTLARCGKHCGEVRRFMEAHGGIALPPFTAGDFHLFESHLGSEGADYRVVETYPLRP